MKGNFHIRFLEEGEGAISPSYSAIRLIRFSSSIEKEKPKCVTSKYVIIFDNAVRSLE
jgi:hypothetical protein